MATAGTANSFADKTWHGFRRWPAWLQVIGWVFGFWLLVPLLLWRTSWPTPVKAGGTGLWALFLIILIASSGDSNESRPTEQQARQAAPVVTNPAGLDASRGSSPAQQAVTSAPASAATATPTPARTPTPAPTPPPPPTPEPVTGPTFAVNSESVGCHGAPEAGALLVIQLPRGTVQAMDQFIRQPDGTWHREVERQCWTRTQPGPVRLLTSLPEADDYAALFRFTPQAVIKSVTDNRNFMPRASTDKLEVEISGGLVSIRITPSLLNETDALTFTTHMAVVASKAIWTTYPEAQSVKVELLNELTDAFGRKSVEPITMIQINRATADKFDYDGLKQRVTSDNKLLFCVADKYQIRPVVYSKIEDKGCLTSPARL